MIYSFDNANDYTRIMVNIVHGFSPPEKLVFDLPDILDLFDLPVSIHRCRYCGRLTHVCFEWELTKERTKELIEEDCPWCDGVLELALEVDLIIHGKDVLYRSEE